MLYGGNMNIDIKNNLEKFYAENVWKHMTLGELLTTRSEKYGEKIAIIEGERKVSFKEFEEITNRYANGFLKEGFMKGDKILLQFPNSIEFIIIAFALFKIGVIPIMALPAHRKTEIKGIIEISKAKAYIAKDKYLGFSYVGMIREIINENKLNLNVFIVGENEEFRNFDEIETDKFKEKVINLDYRDIGLLLLSGGTTGIPKLIPRRHCDYIYVAEYAGKRCRLNEESIYLAALPIAHNFPLGCPGILGTLFYGGTIVICPNTSPDEIIPLIEKENVTITGLVPTMANMCIEFLDMEEYDISSLEIIQIGGSVLDHITAEKIEKGFSCKLQQIFGIAEGLISTTSLDDDDSIVYRTQGKPISEYDDVLIVDEEGKELPIEEYGELIVRGPYTIYGYYNLEEINKTCITEDCYFKTGDKARKLKNGNYQIVGRLKEIINRAGEKITPTELEKILLTHDKIEEVQVVGIPDQILGEKIGVFVLAGDNEITLNEIRTFLKEHGVAHFKLPDLVKKVEAWPLTSVGKISKETLRKSAL